MTRAIAYLCAALLACLLTSPVLAQCPGAVNSSPTFPSPGGNVFGAISSQWKAYFGAKVDANNGILCSPLIQNLPVPVNPNDPATKQYADSVSQAVYAHAPVNAASTASLGTAPVYVNGSGGVGATLTNSVAGILVVDGYSPGYGERLLLKDQANPATNGVYVLSTVGTVSVPWQLTRAPDFNQAATHNIATQAYFFVLNGSIPPSGNKDVGYVLLTPSPIVVGVSPLSFGQFLAAPAYVPFVGDSGLGTGVQGLVPAPSAGTGILNDVLSAAGGFIRPSLNTVLNWLGGSLGVANNTALAAFSTGSGGVILTRDGFAARGDAPPLNFQSETGNCASNGRVNDGGSCVNAGDGGSWVAIYSADGVDVREFGGLCDGSTVITTPITSALATSRKVILPPGTCVSGPFTISNQNELRGAGRGQTNLFVNSASADFITASAYSRITDLALGSTVTRTGGCFVAVPAVNGFQADHFYVSGAFRGFCITGSGIMTISAGSFNSTVTGGDGVYVNGGAALTLGPDITMDGQTSPSAQPHAGIYIVASGDFTILNADLVHQGDCLLVEPGVGQEVDSVKMSISFMDTCGQHGVYLHPKGGVIQRSDFGQSWFATAQKEGFKIDTTFGGSSAVNGTELGMAQIWNNSQAAVGGGASFDEFFATGSNITKVTLNNSMVAAGAGTGAGVHIGASVVGFKMVGTTIGQYGSFSAPPTCLVIDNGADHLNVTGNDVSGCATPLSTTIAGSTIANISGNTGLDDQQPSVASGSTITLALTPIQYISPVGTTINTMNGGWQGRQVLLIPFSGSQTFGSSGNIANSGTFTNPVIATYSGTKWYLH